MRPTLLALGPLDSDSTKPSALHFDDILIFELHIVGLIFPRMLAWLEIPRLGGTWLAQPVKHPPLGFGSGHDLMVL